MFHLINVSCVTALNRKGKTFTHTNFHTNNFIKKKVILENMLKNDKVENNTGSLI